MRRFVFLAAGLACAHLVPAQTSPFVEEKIERALINELSGDLAFEHMRSTTQWHKPSGSEGFFAVARYALEKARRPGWRTRAGSTRSTTPLPGPAGGPRPGFSKARLRPEETKLGSYTEVAMSIADYSRSADVTGELVDVGTGDRASDYEGKEVRGKIVLANGSPALVTEQAVWKRGAAGILPGLRRASIRSPTRRTRSPGSEFPRRMARTERRRHSPSSFRLARARRCRTVSGEKSCEGSPRPEEKAI